MGYIGNAPYQGVLTGGNIQDGTVETTDLADGAVTTVKMGDGQVTVGKLASTLDLTGKTVTLPAGVGGHASGTEANRPATPAIGTIYFNTDEDTLQQYTSAGWKSIGSTPPAISSISGNIYNTIATNLTISGAAFGVAATVRFAYGGSTSDVSVTPSSDTEITVAVPSAVYNQAAGTSVTISVIVSGQVSNGSSKTVIGTPTGGAITTSGGYRYHTFLSSSNLVVPSGFSATVEYLVVAGGGGGGSYGGGGAGGYISGSEVLTAGVTKSITIGAGGPPDSSYGGFGTQGQPSAYGSTTAIGGGYGGTSDSQAGGSGGSGGGGGYTNGQGGPGTSGQGNAGGSGASDSPKFSGGGGGGKNSPGVNATGDVAGNGGAGLSWLNGTTYGGGGGGATWRTSETKGIGGAGGGGNGGTWASNTGSLVQGGSAGSQNKGGGGGGRYAGGSGIVIVRYSIPT